MKIWSKIKKGTNLKNYDPYQKFSNKIWLKKLKKKILENYKSLNNNVIKSNYFISSSPLPFILINFNKNNIKICDFGAGSLESYFQVLILNKKKKIEIDIVEVPGVIKLYKRLKKFLKDKKNIKLNFYSKIPKKKYDILHISDSLQYVEKWENFITDLTKLRPKFIILNNLTAGLIKEYNTYQNFYNEKIFYKFFNIKKVISLFNDYNLEFASPYLNLIKGKYTEYPQPNFKLKDRLGYPCTLIFKLKN